MSRITRSYGCCAQPIERGHAVVDQLRRPPFETQVQRDELANVRLVLDDEHPSIVAVSFHRKCAWRSLCIQSSRAASGRRRVTEVSQFCLRSARSPPSNEVARARSAPRTWRNERGDDTEGEARPCGGGCGGGAWRGAVRWPAPRSERGPMHGGRGFMGGIAGLRQLGLTDDQRQQIRAAISVASRRVQERVRIASARRARRSRRRSSRCPLNEPQIRAASSELAAAEADAAVLRARVHEQVFSLLTPEQQTKAKSLAAERRQFRAQRRAEWQQRMEQFKTAAAQSGGAASSSRSDS